MEKRILLPGLFLLLSCLAQANSTTDTLQNWMSAFSRLRNPVLSEDGRWIAVKKMHYLQKDTILILDSRNPANPVAKFAGIVAPTFLNNSGVLTSLWKGKVEYINLHTFNKNQYDSVQQVYPLPKLNQFALLRKDRSLSLYNIKGQLQYEIKNVIGFAESDKKMKLYACIKDSNNYAVLDLSGKQPVQKYISPNTIVKMQLGSSGSHLFVTSGTKDSSMLTAINLLSTQSDVSEVLSTDKEGYLQIIEIQNAGNYFLKHFRIQPPEKIKIVDIWYGNDNNLETKIYGTAQEKFWLWKSKEKSLLELPNNRLPAITSINNSRYFMAFDPRQGYNYITFQPDEWINTYLYDVEQHTYRKIGNLKGVIFNSPEIICSSDGKYFIASEGDKKWTLFDVVSGHKKIIDKEGLHDPYFSKDMRYILFESEDDAWRYDINKQTLKSLNISSGFPSKILNGEKVKSENGLQISVNSIDLDFPVLIKSYNKKENSTFYVAWHKEKQKLIVPPTKNRVMNLVYDTKANHFYSLEENFNLPPTLYYNNKTRKKITIVASNPDGENISSLKQDIISYTTSEGVSLKGVLYYPIDYNPQKKYPMIVHVYQVQSNQANVYLVPGERHDGGIDIRILLEKGYFVYLADTQIGAAGPGLSALDCVNKALDAVTAHPNINIQKVGLIGHSFGGYEVNFIAAHSDRFAAYSAGSGHSDIVRSYFSYAYHFKGPLYWQFETGQYELGPFKDNKQKYFNNNPIHYVDRVNAPILLWTGKKDQHVLWDHTMEFFIGLKRNKKQVIALFYPDQGHAFQKNSEDENDLQQKMLDWWDYFLKDKKNIQWIGKQMNN